MSYMRALRLFLFAASVGIGGLVRKIYRPWAYQQGVSVFGIADWAPTLLFTFGMAILVVTIAGAVARLRPVKYWAMVGVGAGALAYEVSQAFRAGRWFDWTDVVATIVGTFGAVLVERTLTQAEDR